LPYVLAVFYARAGENDQVLAPLEQAYQRRLPILAWVKVSREWDPLRSDPRFQDLLRRMNLPPYGRSRPLAPYFLRLPPLRFRSVHAQLGNRLAHMATREHSPF
jgi:hypothetical protein